MPRMTVNSLKGLDRRLQMVCQLCLAQFQVAPRGRRMMALVMYGRHAEIVLSAVVRSCLYIILDVLMLTAASLVDNGQRDGQKPPLKLVRNQSGKNGTLSKPSLSPTPERSPTAIDPLSHVRVPTTSLMPHPPATARRESGC